MIVELTEDDKVKVTNLLGHPIEVPILPRFEDLLLPLEDLGTRDGVHYRRVRFRRVNPAALPKPLKAASVLRETARQLLYVVDGQSIDNFDEVWDKLARSEQLDLKKARLSLLGALPNTLMDSAWDMPSRSTSSCSDGAMRTAS